MADAENDETQVPLVSTNDTIEETETKTEEPKNSGALAITITPPAGTTGDNENKPLINTENDTKDQDNPEAIIATSSNSEISVEPSISNTNDTATDKNEKNVKNGTSDATTEKQLENAIALSPKTEEIKENESKSASNDNNNNKNNDNEPFISGLASNTSKKETESKEKEINIPMSDEKDGNLSTLQSEISKLKEKLQNIRKHPPNWFEKYFEQSLNKLNNRQKRQREQQRDRNKSTELSIKQQLVLRGHFGKVYNLDFSFDSEEIVSCSQDGKILIWNVLTTHKRVAIPLMTAWTMTVSWSENAEMIASGGLDNTISIYRIKKDVTGWESKRPFIELLDHEGYISDVKFIDNRHLVSSSGDASAMLFDVDKQCVISKYEHKGDVMSLSVHNEKNLLLTGSTDGTAKVWDLRMDGGSNSKPVSDSTDAKTNSGSTDDSGNTGVILKGESKYSFGKSLTQRSSDVNSVSWFPDGNGFITGCDDSQCKFYDLRSNCQLISYYDSENTCNVTDVAVSKSGKYIYSTYDNDPWCVVWETATGDRKQTVVHPSRPACVKVSPNGFCFATGCWDNKIRIWSP